MPDGAVAPVVDKHVVDEYIAERDAKKPVEAVIRQHRGDIEKLFAIVRSLNSRVKALEEDLESEY